MLEAPAEVRTKPDKNSGKNWRGSPGEGLHRANMKLKSGNFYGGITIICMKDSKAT
jgi:hypothetical protein